MRMFRQYQMCFGEVFLHFQTDVSTLGILNVPGDKNLTYCTLWNVGAVTRKPKRLDAHLDINIFPCFIARSSLLKLDQAC